ncbi:MAG: hypothetical protein WBA97_12165 [Actinophytocola sp.]|uniref:hypothetical protein n=1 Tax=Actinophytocola sp. TaxID=1872138 RepID=UPI003C73702E
MAASLIVAIGLTATSFAVGRSSVATPAAVPQATAAPLRDGIPISNRHSPAGAATAAANFQTAGFLVSSGSLPPDTAADVFLASNADTAARSVLTAPSATTEQLSQERTSYAPLSLVVEDYRGTEATVLVWGVSATSSRVVPEPGGTQTWGRVSVRLIWTEAQWQVVSQEYERGPWPVRSDERLAETQDDFGFRFGELSAHRWTYVPEQ